MAHDDQADNTVPNLLFSGGTQSSFACNACKKKKIKCDRIAPQCSNCGKSNRSCEYPLSVPKPGPKAGFASKKRQHSTGENDEDRNSVRQTHLDTDINGNVINDSLTEIVHPKHQNATSSQWLNGHQYTNGQGSAPINDHGSALAQALKHMAITWQDCQAWINNYFDNMTSFSLFHRPSFDRKLASITNSDELEALLTAMIAFAKPFGLLGEPSAIRNLPASAIWFRARTLARDCLEEYDDETPPLHLLQTLLMTTWNELCMGVRSRGWRTIGECVRICYEMRLHEEDIDRQSHRSWIEREERRRAWYLAWEMDIFASTIRRLPTSISWDTNKTKLPVPDTDWYSGVGSNSCLFVLEPSERWKTLEKSGNTSGMAWFIVMNSYKYEAYLLSTNPQSCSLRYSEERSDAEAIRRHRDMLINCVHCAQLALPDNLVVGDRYLAFRKPDIFDNAWRYMLHHMLQVTKFMLYRLDIFFRPRANRLGSKAQKTAFVPSKLAWEQLITSGGETAKLLRNSAPDHVKWVNPLVANAIWFSAAALVVGQVLGPSTVDRKRLDTNFDLLRATVKEFVKVSKVPEMLVSSLDTLEENLQGLSDEKLVVNEPGRLSSASASDSRSPIMTESDVSRTVTPRSDPLFDTVSPPAPSASSGSAQVPEDIKLGYFDTPGLDMTQTFSDLDALWASTADWNFNIDCFRCPYE